jgi:hypothetical protein
VQRRRSSRIWQDAVDALTDGVFAAALELARASMIPKPKVIPALRPGELRQSLEEICEAFTAYLAKRGT